MTRSRRLSARPISGRTGALLLVRKRRPPAPRRWKKIVLSSVGLSAATILAGAIVVGVGGVTLVSSLSAGLPDPTMLESLDFAQPTLVYDRTGTVELARFQQEGRRVVTFDEVPHLILDVTTTAEDRSFWQNAGFDPAAIMAAVADNLSGTSDRGGSTITQQLVRARLLPADVTSEGSDRYARKLLEIIQSARVTASYPGEEGKERVITAYLNQIFYGHQAYGIAAAAKIYFGVEDLTKLSVAQAALLAALPKSPSELDPYQFASPDANGQLVVDPTSPPVVRRNWVLENLATSARWTTITKADLEAAMTEPVVLAGEPTTVMTAPHFDWQVRREIEQLLGGAEKVETGGYKVVTTLDVKAQQLAEKYTTAAIISSNLGPDDASALLDGLQISEADRKWISVFRGKDVHDCALVAIDYRTGDVLAYVGSAGYYWDGLASPQFSPKYDAAGDGVRQPGSAWKPILYSTAFERNVLTPGSLLLDITTQFDVKQKWAPRDADRLDRGPVLVRGAIQYSLNIPAIRALQKVGNGPVADMAAALGIRFQGGKTAYLQSGLAGAIGTVEVRPLDLVGAYGGIANGGVYNPPRMILSIIGPDGKTVYTAPAPAGKPAMSPQTSFLMTNILSGNTDPKQNPIWSAALELRNGPDGEHRPTAVKTGTADDAKDLATYGYVAPPDDPSAPAIAAGIWVGNSDHSTAQARDPLISLTGAAPIWRAFMRDLTGGLPVADFPQPDGVVQATIDAWSGGAPGPWTRDKRTEWFKAGTEPGGPNSPDQPGLLYSNSCGGWSVDAVKAELGPKFWLPDVADWMSRASRGTGVAGQYDSKTAYFWGRSGWGGPIGGGDCTSVDNGNGDGNGNGNGGGGGGGEPGPAPKPSSAPAPSPTPKNGRH